MIYSSWHPSLKISKRHDYLEASLSRSMKNSNLIHSDLSASGLLTLSVFFSLEIIGMVGGEGGKLESLLIAIVKIDLAQQKYDLFSEYFLNCILNTNLVKGRV
jgi:hypothetical protein